MWDDAALVARDPFIRSWRLLAEGFRHFLFTDATASDFYRPLQRLTYIWDYAWFGFAPWGWHLSNLLFHAGAAGLLFLFLEKWLTGQGIARARGIAAVASAVWVIHPLHSSAVVYVAGRADLLAALFGFAGLYLGLHRSRRAAAGALTCFLAAILAKESGATALGIWLLLRLFDKRLTWRPAASAAAVIAIYAVLRLSAEHEKPPQFSEKLRAAARPIAAARAVAEYAGLLLAPVRLHMERDVLPFGRGDFPTTIRAARLREFQTLLGVLLLAALAWWAHWCARREKTALAALAAFLIAYLPISNLLPLNATVAEHWLYFPSAFLFTAAALSLAHARLSKTAGAALLLAWMAFLAVRTFTRCFDWRDRRTFFESTIADGGDSARMLINLGAVESGEGHQRIASEHFKNALERAPGQPFAVLGLGGAELRAGDWEGAREQFEKALRDPVVRAEAMQDLAVLEYKQSGRDRVDLLRESAALAPKDWSIQKRYLGHLDERGETKNAIVELQKILASQWWRGDSWRLLGDFWMRERQLDSARRAYLRAAQLDVHDDSSRRKSAEL